MSVASSTPFVTGLGSTGCTAADVPSKPNAGALVQVASVSAADALIQARCGVTKARASSLLIVLLRGNTQCMGTVIKSVKVPRSLAAALARTAKARGVSESELIREGIEHVAGEDQGLDMVALIGPDLGVGRGPGDLSTNRKRMAGYGRSRHR